MISVHVGEFFEGLVGNEMQIYEGSKRFNITRDYGKNWFVTREFLQKGERDGEFMNQREARFAS